MYKAHGRLDISDELISNITLEASIPNRYVFMHTGKTVEYCLDLGLALNKNISETPFITSDKRVVKYNQLFMVRNYFRPHGYGYVGIQIYLPISPRL